MFDHVSLRTCGRKASSLLEALNELLRLELYYYYYYYFYYYYYVWTGVSVFQSSLFMFCPEVSSKIAPGKKK